MTAAVMAKPEVRPQMHGSLLLVDDETFNLEILRDTLEPIGYATKTASNGLEALALIRDDPYRFNVILLDRMMPLMNGIEVIRQIRYDASLRHLCIIMQTARATNDNVMFGLAAGASYYLTKPLNMEMMLSIVGAAVQDSLTRRTLLQEVHSSDELAGQLTNASFTFRTLEEGRTLAALLAKACPNPERAALGLCELLVNAVEHGNLGIDYDRKGELNSAGRWADEVAQRLAQPENADKKVNVTLERTRTEVKITILDQGRGFDWLAYLELDPTRAFDSHGRGIAMARRLSFGDLQFRQGGREVEARISLTACD